MNFKNFIFLFSLAVLTCCGDSYAGNLKKTVKGLNILSVNYGINEFSINGEDISIIRGLFQSEVAHSADGYIIILNDKKPQTYARIWDENRSDNDVMIWNEPHTGEDSIRSIYFLSSKNSKGLYMLKSERKIKDIPTNPAITEFTLYKLIRDKDFGIHSFKEMAIQTSKKTYCNSDIAANLELGIGLDKSLLKFTCSK